MKETPPHTLLEIKLLLSQYLDEVLEPEQVREVDALLSRFPQYVEELRKLRQTREALQTALNAQALPVDSDTGENSEIWRSISERLTTDLKGGARSFDAEFVSAYYDGEISAVDAEFIEFESQLFHNAEANETLARMGEISETVRQFGYRLETGCTIDVAQDVIAAFRAEQPLESGHIDEAHSVNWNAPVPAELELMSAYADQALTPRETIEANRLIESDKAAKEALSQFTNLSERLASVHSQIQSQAPDLWPAISEILNKPPEEGGLVVPIDRFRVLKRWGKIAGPIAAAVLLMVLFTPAKQSMQAPTLRIAQAIPVQPQAVVTPVVAYQQSPQDHPAEEIASVPVSSRNTMNLALVSASDESMPDRQAGIVPAMDVRRSSRSMDERPMVIDPKPARVAARPLPRAAEPEMVASGKNAPSSEEYLFNALNEQMPGEDVSSILGK